MRNIYVFLHVCSVKRYIDVFNEVWQKSIALHDRCTKFFINVVGPGRMEHVIPKSDKIVLNHYSDNVEEHEFPTQHMLKKLCKEEECYVCYYHLRGVTTYPDNLNVLDNRNYIMHFVIEKYHLGLNLLEDGFDAVSVDLSYWPTRHFSSNMWWAKSEHINNLVAMEDLPEIYNFYQAHDKKARHRCEMWITSKDDGKYIELWNCGLHPSQKGFVRYPPENYRNKF